MKTEQQEDYKGFTHKELDSKFSYDPNSGKIYNKKSGKLMDSTRQGSLYIGIRRGTEVITLSSARVALILEKNLFLKQGETIRFKDGDNLNLKIDNILVIEVGQNNTGKTFVEEPYSVATATKGVYQIMPKGFFVARRGPTQAIYRTNSYEEAVKIRKEWEKDKTIHRWDATTDMSYIPVNS